MITPAEARACREGWRIGGGDLYAAEGLSQFVHPASIQAQLKAECRDIASILNLVPDFAFRCDYLWTAESASYDVLSEAAFQRRLLLMLAEYWVKATDKTKLSERLRGVIVSQEFITRYGFCSPRIKAVAQHKRLLSIPAGFIELALWLFVGLRCWMAVETGWGNDDGGDGGWTMVTSAVQSRSPKPFDHVTIYELIARTLAERGRDRALYGTNAALLIREQVPGLKGETGELDADKLLFFDQNATYLVAEFALAHELGHLVAGHSLSNQGAPSDSAHEAEADCHACLLLAMSSATRLFGWGEDILKPWVQAALGLALFDCLLAGRTILNDGLLRRPGIVEAETNLIVAERLRAASVRIYLQKLLVRIASDGDVEEAQRVARLVDNNDAFLRDVRLSLAALPDEEVKMAIEIAEGSVGSKQQ